jgi:hypothetical protein
VAAKKQVSAEAPTTPAAKAPSCPPGTDVFLWSLAAAFADVPVEQLWADTATVKATHYEAAQRAEKVFDAEWLRIDEKATEDKNSHAAEGADIEGDPFARLMLLAEDFGHFVEAARDRGDAARAARYSGFSTAVLQVAAAVNSGNDIEVGK